jgi:hypothetical protein
MSIQVSPRAIKLLPIRQDEDSVAFSSVHDSLYGAFC